jgi:hypothetical protein
MAQSPRRKKMSAAGYKAENALGYVQVTAVSAAVGVGDIPAGTTLIIVIPESQAVRWRDDGTDPTAAVGMPLAVGAVLEYTGAQMARLKFFEQAASAKLNITFYGN